MSHVKNGVGGLCPPHNWFYMPWPAIVRENRENILGVKFASKLSCLEGFRGLLGLVCVPDIARNSEIDLRIDNAGFVGIYRKKHSSCPYAYTVAKATLYQICPWDRKFCLRWQGIQKRYTLTKF